jgi:hypothetical protein
MAANFDILLNRMLRAGVKPNTNAAREWFRKKIRDARVSRQSLLSDRDRSRGRPQIGRMYCYAYDPKYADKLPYYDEFPLIFMVKPEPGGFLGINLHYVSPRNRIVIMDSLSRIANNDKYDETTKLQLTWRTLSNLSKFKMIKPCVKKYLYSHVRSKFVMIEANEWDLGIFLPVQKFRKAGPSKVWSDSAQMGR